MLSVVSLEVTGLLLSYFEIASANYTNLSNSRGFLPVVLSSKNVDPLQMLRMVRPVPAQIHGHFSSK
jgi:hypothetical protein